MKLINTYKGSSFKELIKAYSNARMQRDRNYRQGVFQLLEERKPKEDAQSYAPPNGDSKVTVSVGNNAIIDITLPGNVAGSQDSHPEPSHPHRHRQCD